MPQNNWMIKSFFDDFIEDLKSQTYSKKGRNCDANFNDYNGRLGEGEFDEDINIVADEVKDHIINILIDNPIIDNNDSNSTIFTKINDSMEKIYKQIKLKIKREQKYVPQDEAIDFGPDAVYNDNDNINGSVYETTSEIRGLLKVDGSNRNKSVMQNIPSKPNPLARGPTRKGGRKSRKNKRKSRKNKRKSHRR